MLIDMPSNADKIKSMSVKNAAGPILAVLLPQKLIKQYPTALMLLI